MYIYIILGESSSMHRMGEDPYIMMVNFDKSPRQFNTLIRLSSHQQ